MDPAGPVGPGRQPLCLRRRDPVNLVDPTGLDSILSQITKTVGGLVVALPAVDLIRCCIQLAPPLAPYAGAIGACVGGALGRSIGGGLEFDGDNLVVGCIEETVGRADAPRLHPRQGRRPCSVHHFTAARLDDFAETTAHSEYMALTASAGSYLWDAIALTRH